MGLVMGCNWIWSWIRVIEGIRQMRTRGTCSYDEDDEYVRGRPKIILVSTRMCTGE